MTLTITSVVRTSTVDPVAVPFAFDISYTGAAGAVTVTDSTGTTIGTGSSGSDTVSVVVPDDRFVLNDPFAGGGIGLDDGTAYGFNLQFEPLFPAELVTQLSKFEFSFEAAYTAAFGADGAQIVPYDYSITHPFNGSQIPSPGFVFYDPLTEAPFFIMAAPRVSLLWDFGDGDTSTSPNPTHVYAAPGTYTVSITYTYESGLNPATLTQTFDIVIPASGWRVGAVGSG